MVRNISAVSCLGFVLCVGCSRVKTEPVQASTAPGAAPAAAPAPAPDPAAAAQPAPPPAPPAITLAAGTKFRVRLIQAIDTQRNRVGDRFTASLDEPLVEGDRVVVPKNTAFSGHIVECKSSGRFKGRAALGLQLDSFELRGETYRLRSSESERVSAGHKKHNLTWIGGGSGGGAAIGAIAGGGAGALIGAGAGAAAGTIGSAITGKRNIHLPAETALTFSLKSPVTL